MGYKVLSNKGNTVMTAYRDNNSHADSGIEPVHEPSDVAQTIKELNDDTVTFDKFSSIDMKARLHNVEISSIIAVDALVALDFLPEQATHITRSKKRLSVSLKGLGRAEIVQISQGMQDKENGKSMFERMGSFFGGGNK